jgi:hypothetical protein
MSISGGCPAFSEPPPGSTLNKINRPLYKSKHSCPKFQQFQIQKNGQIAADSQALPNRTGNHLTIFTLSFLFLRQFTAIIPAKRRSAKYRAGRAKPPADI